MFPVKKQDVGLPEHNSGGAFTFDDKDHTYRLDDRQIPSTSEILDILAPMEWTPNSQDGMERGTRVHEITAFHDLAVLNHSAVSDDLDELMPYLSAWTAFLTDFAQTFRGQRVIVEAPIYCRSTKYARLEYGATLDRILPDIGLGIEIKTGSTTYKKRYAMQAQAYMHAVRSWGIRIDTMIQVHLLPDGVYRIANEHKYDKSAVNIFKAGLTVWRFQNNNQK